MKINSKYMKQLEYNRANAGDIYSHVTKKKKNKKTVSDKDLYNITLTNYIYHLYQMICIINDIDELNYFAIDEYTVNLIRNMKINDRFKELSRLDWDTPADINSPTYRGRFATLLLYYMARNSHKTISSLVDRLSKGNHKYEVYNKALNQLIITVDSFITGFLSSDVSYSWSLQGIMEILAVANEYDTEVVLKFEEVRELLSDSVNDKTMDAGIKVNNIIKTAFAITTYSTGVKKTPKYVENFPMNNQDLKEDQVGKLGYAIYDKWNKKDSRNILYDIFIKSKPLMYSAVPDVNERPEVAIGVQSLYFLKLCMDNRSISKYIDKLIVA